MRMFNIHVDESYSGGYDVKILDTKFNGDNRVVLTEEKNLTEEEASELIASLNLVLLRYFDDYKPCI